FAADEDTPLSRQNNQQDGHQTWFVAKKLPDVQCIGGPDNITFFKQTWRLAYGTSDAIVWIHRPQPLLSDLPSADKARFAFGYHKRVPIYDFEVENGPDVIAEVLSDKLDFKRVSRSGTVLADLTRFFGNLCRTEVQTDYEMHDAQIAESRTAGVPTSEV